MGSDQGLLSLLAYLHKYEPVVVEITRELLERRRLERDAALVIAKLESHCDSQRRGLSGRALEVLRQHGPIVR